MGGSVKDVQSKKELDSLVHGGAPVVLHFWASWCETSKHMDEVFAHLSADFPLPIFFFTSAGSAVMASSDSSSSSLARPGELGVLRSSPRSHPKSLSHHLRQSIPRQEHQNQRERRHQNHRQGEDSERWFDRPYKARDLDPAPRPPPEHRPILSQVFSSRNPCYFNTGVMVMDLVRWREGNYRKRIENWMELQRKRRIYELGSLPPFLLVFAGNVEAIDHRWNQHGLGGDNVRGSCRSLHPGPVSLLHWSGKGKPWVRLKTKNPCPLDHLWVPHMIIIDNLEKGLSPSTIMEFIHQQLSISCQAFVSPSKLLEIYARGGILLHSKRNFDKLLAFLENPQQGYGEQCCKQVDPLGRTLRDNLIKHREHGKALLPPHPCNSSTSSSTPCTTSSSSFWPPWSKSMKSFIDRCQTTSRSSSSTPYTLPQALAVSAPPWLLPLNVIDKIKVCQLTPKDLVRLLASAAAFECD